MYKCTTCKHLVRPADAETFEKIFPAVGGLWECNAGQVEVYIPNGKHLSNIFALSGWMRPNLTVADAAARCTKYEPK